jgi:hypothetical protein
MATVGGVSMFSLVAVACAQTWHKNKYRAMVPTFESPEEFTFSSYWFHRLLHLSSEQYNGEEEEVA